MAATKKDVSGVFDSELRVKRPQRASFLDQVEHLSCRGVTFVSDTFWPEWTEVGVEMRLPHAVARKDQHFGCRGVVVQCVPCEQGKGFEVALLFLDLPKRARAQLLAPASVNNPLRIALSR